MHVRGSEVPAFGTPGDPFRGPAAPRPPFFTVERAVRLLFGAALVAVGVWLLWYFGRLVVYLIIGVVLAYLMRPLVERLQGWGLGRIPAILITFVAVFGTLGVLVVYISPFVAEQVSELSQQFSPEAVDELAVLVEAKVRQFLPIREGAIMAGMERGFDALFEDDQIAATVTSALDLFTDLFYAVLVIPFVAFFFLKDGIHIRHAYLHLVPNRYFEISLAVIEKIEVNIGRYFRALLLDAVSVALVSFILLSAIGLDNALFVGIFTGLANTIPYFGPLVGLVAGALVGFSQTGDFSLFPGVLIAMGIMKLIDDVVFQPLYFSRAAQAHPLVILFVVLVGAQVAGLVGMLVAIPVATTLRVAAQQVFWSLRNYRILKTA